MAEYSTVYSDAEIVVLNKKSAYLVAADRYDTESPRLDEAAKKEFGELFAVHRIDTDASGLVLYARNEKTQEALLQQFKDGKVEQIFHCLVYGRPQWKDLDVELKLLPDGDQRHRTTVNKRIGKFSKTEFKLLCSTGPYSWIEAIPRTNRTHQIRVHLQQNGVNIVCDPLYSGNQKPVRLSDIKKRWNGDTEEERPLLKRLALHAWSISFEHPADGKRLTFTAPYQKDMDATRNQLAKIFGEDPLEKYQDKQ
ncbi:MAG: RluA family pseudouridine synthase [Treponema sp.]|nr:RluA family pseudouridine synthase [Treponema sp.]